MGTDIIDSILECLCVGKTFASLDCHFCEQTSHIYLQTGISLLGQAFLDGNRHFCVHTGMFMCGKFFLALIGIFNANWHFFDWTDIFYVDRKNFLNVECPF